MDTSTLRTLSLRTAILASIGVTTLATQACDDASGTGGAGGATATSGSSTSGKSSSSASGSTTSAGTTTATTSTTTGSATASSSTGGGMMDVERCFTPAMLPCPEKGMAVATFGECTANGERVTTWISGPTEKQGQCCYQVDVTDPGDPACGVVGRPLLVEAAPRRATVTSRANGWSARSLAPRVADLSESERLALARAWAEEAAFEHASVAAFSKTALELIALGAPRDLVAACHRAALDEIDHASMGFALASAYSSAPVSPGAFADATRATFATNLVDLAVAAAREGCVGETLAALVAGAQRDAATDPAVKSALLQIAADEARHAELSYQIVAWAIREGGASVRDAVRAAFADAIAEERARISAARRSAPRDGDVLSAHGRVGALTIAEEKARGLDEVVAPSMLALLG